MTISVTSQAGSPSRGAFKALVKLMTSPEFKAIWNGVKRLFSARPAGPMLAPLEISIRKSSLERELLHSMGDACAALPPGRREAFAALAAAMVEDVLTDCMFCVQKESSQRSGQEVREVTFQKAAAKARQFVDRHLEVAQSLDREKLDAPVVRTVWVENPAGPGQPKVKRVVVVRAAPPIENLVLRGGGAKGIGNPPALRALENLGKLSELKKVVGTSAGALTAVCLASGMSATEFQKLSNDTGMLSLLSSPSGFKQRYPEVQLGRIGFGAGQALETLDRSSATSVTRYLRSHWAELLSLPQWSQLDPADQQRLTSLRDQDLEQSPRTGQMITFRDLHLLHQLVPSKFKELVLTGYNASAKENVYFSAATHPDMPVALAGRISMSIPVFFKAVEMKVDGKTQKFVDGGVGSNMPSEASLNGLHGKALDDAQARTLLMTYDEDGAAYSILHSSPAERKKMSSGLMGRLTNDRLDNEKTYFASTNVLPVFHGKLGTFSFLASKKTVEEAQTQSMLKALEHIENVMGHVRHDMVNDEAAAARLLSASEQQQFLLQHEGDGEPCNHAVCEAIRRLQGLPQAAALDERLTLMNAFTSLAPQIGVA